jgi:transaldolase
MNRIRRLEELGQSVWLDYIDHDLLASGELRRMIERDGLRGVTSNPTIFQKAIAHGADYDAFVFGLPPSETDEAILQRIMVRDIAFACDTLRPVYEVTSFADGFASIEVAPSVAMDAAGSIEQACRLWYAVQRPNVMVKIPGTRPGLLAIESCLAHGINVNVTLLFSLSRYREVIEAHLRALEARAARKDPIDRIASVASFFVSRVDTKIDKLLDAAPSAMRGATRELRGQIAIANAKLAYEEWERIYTSDRWKKLAALGARPQRLLWASTSPKDPAYRDVYYVEALIGRDTVDTMTPDCFRAYLDHGDPAPRLALERSRARERVEALGAIGVDLAAITDELEVEGVASFAESYRRAIETIGEKRRTVAAPQPRA